MNRDINREIFRLAIPSILANVTIPLVGIVDTAIAGHVDNAAAVLIGAIALGSTIFNILYWNISFLRTGTGGLTAQAYGRGDDKGCARIFARAEILALICSAVLLLLQYPLGKLAMLCIHGSDIVEEYTLQYFYIRVWAAPATFSLMAFSGWFIGLQDSMNSMWKDLVVNVVNIAASLLLAFGAKMGFRGIVWGTVIAQYSGLAFCILVSLFKYRTLIRYIKEMSLRDIFVGGNCEGSGPEDNLSSFFKMNADLVGRSLGFCGIYLGYTLIAAKFGDTMLACSSILMQILMIFSYVMDGFAYAGEALTGRFVGARDSESLKAVIRQIMFWGFAVAIVFVGIYAALGESLLKILTSDRHLVYSCMKFWIWMLLMPPLSCVAFLWDGIFLGATRSREIRNAMLGSMLCFLGLWFALKFAFNPRGTLAIHFLMTAYFAHLLFRTIYLSYRSRVITSR